MKLKYFGTDGVRGVANRDLSPELAFKVGRAGGYVLTRYSERKQPQVLVSRDTRISGQMLENALVAGLLSVGIEVLRLGVVTTPGVAYLVRAQGADAGVMITAIIQSNIMESSILAVMASSFPMSWNMRSNSCWMPKRILCHGHLMLVWERLRTTTKARSNTRHFWNRRFQRICLA